MIRYRDTGVVPESLFPAVSGSRTLAAAVADPGFPLQRAVDAAFAASAAAKALPDGIRASLGDPSPVICYWAAMACRIGPRPTDEVMAALQRLTTNPHAGVRVAAAVALDHHLPGAAGLECLLAELARPDCPPMAQLDALDHLERSGQRDRIPAAWLKALASEGGNEDYLNQRARHLLTSP